MTLPGVHPLDSKVQMPLALVLPVRAVVFELPNARVLLAPGTKLTREQLESAGPITDIVATSLMHAAGVKKAAELYPNATLWGPKGVKEKYPEVSWQKILGQDAWPYEEALPHHALEGLPKVNESVFLHRASKALYVTDLAFNILEPKGAAAGLLFRLFGTWRRFAVSRIFLRFVEDRAALTKSVSELLSLDFQHVIPSHGDTAENDGKERLRQALKERSLI